MTLAFELWLLLAVVLVNAIYYLAFAKFAFYKPTPPEPDHSTPVSIVVCAKNEAENLERLVPQLLAQKHDDFEVILVNDRSSDGTLDVIDRFREIDKRVQKVNVEHNENFWGNKKYALTLGIKKASHQRMLFIDADCEPASDQWLALMNARFGESQKIILGFGGLRLKGPALLRSISVYETLMTAVQYFSYALWGNPYMGVGRNLAYTSDTFYDNRGFMGHMKVMGGDDDLFVNESANGRNTNICVERDAFTYTDPKLTWSSWWKQKRRHINTAKHYKGKDKFLLGLFYASQLLFFILGVVCLFTVTPVYWVLAILAVRYLIVYLVLGFAFAKLSRAGNTETDFRKLIPFILPLEWALTLVQLFLGICNGISRPKDW